MTFAKYVPVRYIVDDKLIDRKMTFEVFEVIEPVWFTVRTGRGEEAYRETCRQFTKEQIHLYAIWKYFIEVQNGGHYQFCSNPAWIVWRDAIAGFRALGLEGDAVVLEELLACLAQTLILGGNNWSHWIQNRILSVSIVCTETV